MITKGISKYVRGQYIYLRITPSLATKLGIKQYVPTKQPNTAQGNLYVDALIQQLYTEINQKLNTSTTAGTFAEYFQMFLQSESFGKAEKTITGWRTAYTAIIVNQGYANTNINDITIQPNGKKISVVEKILNQYINTGTTSATTKHDYYRAFRRFVQWLLDSGELTIQPRFKLIKNKLPASSGKPIRIYTQDEVERMIEYNLSLSQPHRTEFAYFIALMWDTPLRIHEPLELRRSDFDFTTKRINVKSKDGKRIEYIPITATIEVIYNKLLQLYPSRKKLFSWENNNKRLRLYLLDTFKNTGIERNGRLWHEFKKSYITRLMQKLHTKELSIDEIVTLSRCSLDVLRKHYWYINPNVVSSPLESISIEL